MIHSVRYYKDLVMLKKQNKTQMTQVLGFSSSTFLIQVSRKLFRKKYLSHIEYTVQKVIFFFIKSTRCFTLLCKSNLKDLKHFNKSNVNKNK